MRYLISVAVLAVVAAIALPGCAQKSPTRTASKSKSVEGQRKSDKGRTRDNRSDEQKPSENETDDSTSEQPSTTKENGKEQEKGNDKGTEPAAVKAKEISSEPEPKETAKDPAESEDPASSADKTQPDKSQPTKTEPSKTEKSETLEKPATKPNTTKQQGNKQPGTKQAAKKRPAAKPNKPAVAKTTEIPADWLDGPPQIPKVAFSAAQTELNKTGVGDTLPNLTLPDAEGATTELYSLFGKKWTVVCFWSGDRALARDELADLGPDVGKPFASQGIRVVGIAVNETAETAKGFLEQTKATFPNLIDADGSALEKVGSGKLPRTYLVDAEGKILWFDIEYSRSTRRDLRRAIAQLLSGK